MFARVGVAVTLITRRRLLPEAEPEISEALTGYLRDEGITVRTGLTYRGIARTAAGVELSITTDGAQQVIAAEQVLVATGRAPNTDGLGLVEAGIAQADNGSVGVDDRMRTSRSEEHTSELQSLMRISHAVF